MDISANVQAEMAENEVDVQAEMLENETGAVGEHLRIYEGPGLLNRALCRAAELDPPYTQKNTAGHFEGLVDAV
ncbi:hypothetical protein PF005_g28956 [Phytophthora fragariae]|uniref:Uncharacterized protein n=1 Tax=Phytophthora fragariae TaxID=53985 RepID=A0A6A3DTS8_9STRA|nr:hypothetical protein PF009_g27086 [Phytophthora fragariae]KAE9139546.1 hypothetical protein PF006_g13723 [Phytophthora fragariae]KAE9167015.1 hypothetical protein PF005_g28956 [Phytophthora fragariae]KAE9195635.1 hypothetical protein PF004_g20377 [Phytophthora fragariae]KAE9302538.1 hypothetical protein PF001_g13964 [Phytophthora fragariae]